MDNKPIRRRRTCEDFMNFCKIVLDYEQYDESSSQVRSFPPKVKFFSESLRQCSVFTLVKVG